MNIKKLIVILIGLMVAGASVASPNSNANQKAKDNADSKGNSSSQCTSDSEDSDHRNSTAGKSTIAHCGCNSDGTGLVWKVINVSNNAKGHAKHIEGHSTICTSSDEDTGEDVVATFTRGAADCRLDEEGLLLDVCDDLSLDDFEALEDGASISCEAEEEGEEET